MKKKDLLQDNSFFVFSIFYTIFFNTIIQIAY